MTPHNPQEEIDETEKCYLEYVEGYLRCTYNHNSGALCLGNKCEYCQGVKCICYQEETKKLVFESREEALKYFCEEIATEIDIQPTNPRPLREIFNQWLSEEEVIIKEELKDK